MTAPLTLAQATAPSSRYRPGPARTVLRLHSAALALWALVVTAISALLLWTYGPGAKGAATEWRWMCAHQPDGCQWGIAIELYHLAYTLAGLAIVWLPVLVAAWAGAALVAPELENGTVRVAWTQGVSPARWLAAKLAVPAVLLTAGTAVPVLLHRLVYEAREPSMKWTWYGDPTFTANGTTALAGPLLALAVGALAGLALRRALPALALAVLGTVPLRLAADRVRPRLWSWATDGTAPANDLPSSLFWPFHLIETTILLTLTAAACATAFWLLHRRTA